MQMEGLRRVGYGEVKNKQRRNRTQNLRGGAAKGDADGGQRREGLGSVGLGERSGRRDIQGVEREEEAGKARPRWADG